MWLLVPALGASMSPRSLEGREHRDRTQRTQRRPHEGLIIQFESFENTTYETSFPLNCLKLFSFRKGEFSDFYRKYSLSGRCLVWDGIVEFIAHQRLLGRFLGGGTVDLKGGKPVTLLN